MSAKVLKLNRLVGSLIAYLFTIVYMICVIISLVFIWIKCFKKDPFQHIGCFALSEVLFFMVIIVIISVIQGYVTGKDKKSFIGKLATWPGKNNYNWQGGYSIFAASVLYTVTMLRSISCLQLSKLIYRGVVTTDKDEKAKRANVSPMFQELYFLMWSVFLCLQMFWGWQNHIILGLNIYFLVESLMWIMYYAFFRRFYEENYSIYHALEHLMILLLIIPLQAIAYARISTYGSGVWGWQDALMVLLGQTERNHTLFSAMGFLYSAIIISMILAMFPVENIKRGNPHTYIIGAGDVVQKRLLPAMLRRMKHLSANQKGTIRIFTRESVNNLKETWKLNDKEKYEVNRIPEKTESIYRLIQTKNSAVEVVAWVSTPSDTHWYYTELLQNKADFIVVEKPIASGEHDLKCFKQFIDSDWRKNTFFLSYYFLEKALPLTFLKRPNDFYLKYLSGNIEEYYQKYLELGELKEFHMCIQEGEDNRNIPQGGQLIETFVHNCLIASLFVGLPDTWRNSKFQELSESRIILKAESSDKVQIDLKLIKGAEYKRQNATIVYSKGIIDADFDKKYARINMKGDNTSYKVKVAEEFSGQYDVQCNMVYDCYANKMDPSNIDGLYHQVEVLEWLLEEYRSNID